MENEEIIVGFNRQKKVKTANLVRAWRELMPHGSGRGEAHLAQDLTYNAREKVIENSDWTSDFINITNEKPDKF